MANLGLQGDGAFPLIEDASLKYHVPPWLLSGVFGMETSFGANVATSSTGAMGAMQFEPATARRYGYPMTNTPNTSQLRQQFDAAAHYLSDLFHQTGSWGAAITHYSGGGYSLSQVQAKAQQGSGSSVVPVVPGLLGGGNNPATSAGNWGTDISGVFNQAVSDAKYGVVLVIMLAVGAVLILHGFGGAKNPRPVVVPV